MSGSSRSRGSWVIAVCLCALGSLYWFWRVSTPPPLSDHKGKTSVSKPPRPLNKSPLVGAPLSATPGTAEAPESSEIQSIRTELTAARQQLAMQQMKALEVVAEPDQSEALAAFAETHAHEMVEIAALESRLQDPKINPPLGEPLPEAQAAQLRFADVRRMIREQGLSLEEAEAQVETVPTK